jgi:hypothetical protein
VREREIDCPAESLTSLWSIERNRGQLEGRNRKTKEMVNGIDEKKEWRKTIDMYRIH